MHTEYGGLDSGYVFVDLWAGAGGQAAALRCGREAGAAAASPHGHRVHPAHAAPQPRHRADPRRCGDRGRVQAVDAPVGERDQRRVCAPRRRGPAVRAGACRRLRRRLMLSAVPADSGRGDHLGELMAAVRPEFCGEVIAVSPEDPVFGRGLCGVAGCGRSAWARDLCSAHHQRWANHAKPDLGGVQGGRRCGRGPGRLREREWLRPVGSGRRAPPGGRVRAAVPPRRPHREGAAPHGEAFGHSAGQQRRRLAAGAATGALARRSEGPRPQGPEPHDRACPLRLPTPQRPRRHRHRSRVRVGRLGRLAAGDQGDPVAGSDPFRHHRPAVAARRGEALGEASAGGRARLSAACTSMCGRCCGSADSSPDAIPEPSTRLSPPATRWSPTWCGSPPHISLLTPPAPTSRVCGSFSTPADATAGCRDCPRLQRSITTTCPADPGPCPGSSPSSSWRSSKTPNASQCCPTPRPGRWSS